MKDLIDQDVYVLKEGISIFQNYFKYLDGMKYISRLNKLPDTFVLDGVEFTKNCKDSVLDSLPLTTFEKRVTFCCFTGRGASSRNICAGIRATTTVIGNDFSYSIVVDDLSLVNKMLEGCYDKETN